MSEYDAEKVRTTERMEKTADGCFLPKHNVHQGAAPKQEPTHFGPPKKTRKDGIKVVNTSKTEYFYLGELLVTFQNGSITFSPALTNKPGMHQIAAAAMIFVKQLVKEGMLPANLYDPDMNEADAFDNCPLYKALEVMSTIPF